LLDKNLTLINSDQFCFTLIIILTFIVVMLFCAWCDCCACSRCQWTKLR